MAIFSIQMVELIDTIMSIPSCLQDQQSKIQVSPSLPACRTNSPRYRSVNSLPASRIISPDSRDRSVHPFLQFQDKQSKIQVC
jgi:hypothetical protein